MDFECYHNTYIFGDTTFGDVQFLMTAAMVYHYCSYEMVTVSNRHYKLLLVTNFECHHNTYTFDNATFNNI